MIGKNVGIRRARGEFVLATNPNLLFSDNVTAFMAFDKLLSNVIYRIDRHDVPAEVPDNMSIDQQFAWCAANVLRIRGRRGSLPPFRVAFFLRFWTRIRNPAVLSKKLKKRVSLSLSPLYRAFWYRLLSLRWENLKHQASAYVSVWRQLCI
jgi:hypothetical protein